LNDTFFLRFSFKLVLFDRLNLLVIFERLLNIQQALS